MTAIQAGCDCSETSTCAEHERRERADRLLAYWHQRRREDALNTARILVAAEPWSTAELDAIVALNRYSGVPHGLARATGDLADWAFGEATRERNMRWRRAFPSEVIGPVPRELTDELELWLRQEVGCG